MREIDSSISVPPRSLTPQRRASVAASSPIFTQLACTLLTVRPRASRNTAVFRLALGRTVKSVQASWVKMGLDAATEALRWGVNDLGGTLMEESISRMAGSYHGIKLEPSDFVE